MPKKFSLSKENKLLLSALDKEIASIVEKYKDKIPLRTISFTFLVEGTLLACVNECEIEDVREFIKSTIEGTFVCYKFQNK